MCNITTQAIINEVLEEFIDNKKAFTAFEVSLAVKKKGAVERHRDMRDYIHGRMIDEVGHGNYSKNLVEVGEGVSGTIQAFLYYPDTYDINSYKPLHRKNHKTQITVAAPTPDTVSLNTEVHELDYRNRLMVPTRFMREVADPGQLVHIVSDNGSVYLTKDNKNNTTSTKMVERDGDLRLYSSVLGLTGNKFVIESVDYSGQKAVKISVA